MVPGLKTSNFFENRTNSDPPPPPVITPLISTLFYMLDSRVYGRIFFSYYNNLSGHHEPRGRKWYRLFLSQISKFDFFFFPYIHLLSVWSHEDVGTRAFQHETTTCRKIVLFSKSAVNSNVKRPQSTMKIKRQFTTVSIGV